MPPNFELLGAHPVLDFVNTLDDRCAVSGATERLAGYGDLLASVEQRERPEIQLGAALARGQSLSDASREAKLRVEAVELIPRVLAWAGRHVVSVPVFTALANGVLGARGPELIIRDLMTAPVEDRG